MGEEIGFTIRGVALGVALALLAVLILFTLITLVLKGRANLDPEKWRCLAAVAIVPGFIGCAVAEIAILSDEINFIKEIETLRRNPDDERHSRSRSWPNGSGSLLWERSRGVWSGD